MSTNTRLARSPDGGRATPSLENAGIWAVLLKYLGLAALNAMALIIIYAFLDDDNLGLAIVIIVITVFANVVTFVPRLYPIRWMAPGLMLVILFVVYPVLYTIVTAFSNYGDSHILTKSQAIELIERRQFVPDTAQSYSWDLYQNEAGDYGLWLDGDDSDGNRVVAFAIMGEPIQEVETDNEEPPELYEGFRLLTVGEQAQAMVQLQNAIFGTGEDTAAIANRRQAARPLVQQYVFDEERNAFLDQETGSYYLANDKTGFFVLEGGTSSDRLIPGYRVGVGLSNFQRLYEDRTLLTPLIDVFLWTIVFAILSVITTFGFGLFMALVLDHPFIPFPKIWRSIIFIPYAIPGVISILVWRALLNQNLGLITNTLFELTGYRIPWFTDPWHAKSAIILVNLWLGYPYMMLVCSGALKAIPSELYEAASVDGAEAWQSFWRITLPMLLVSVGPLLIASFTYNFNNYLLIEVLAEGNPPIPGTSTPAGYTDILISYTYNLAFGSNQGADYGYAAAITIVIFTIVALITLFNYRYVARWERVGESV
ncbi:MAG: maltose ABC transporter permease MalF [Aggregatilineales bacterium]